jgi:hypothetical protein
VERAAERRGRVASPSSTALGASGR